MEDDLTPLRLSPLWQAVWKLDWADEQFVAAHNLMQNYLDENKCGVREDFDEEGHRFTLYAKTLPKFLPSLIGSGIHALRSSLDTAVTTLVQGITGSVSGRVNFPFHETEQYLLADFKPQSSKCGKCGTERISKPRNREIVEHLPELQTLLFDTFKPWKIGNPALWSLNKLDNIQKHRTLLLVFGETSVNLDYYAPSEGIMSKANLWIIRPNEEIVIASSREQIIVTSGPNVSFELIFPEGMPFRKEPVFEVVGQLYKLTRGILKTLHARFEGHPALSG